MSIALIYHGIVEPTDEFKKKYEAFMACRAAGVNPPQELWRYFGNDEPNPSGLVVEIKSKRVRVNEYSDVFEIDLRHLRPDITKIQIGVSY